MTKASESSSGFEYEAVGVARPPKQKLVVGLAVLIALAHFITLVYLARQHPFGNYATETDFYHFYAPDAERIAAGQFPQNTYQGPGYPAALALVAKLTGTGDDLFTAGKWMSVVCAVLCGLLVFVLFARLFGYWAGLGAQLIAIASGEFPQFSINAATDVFFLQLCLAVLVVFTTERIPLRWRVALTGALAALAYLTRYNGLFLPAACLIGIVLLNLFGRDWRERWVLSAIFIAAFFITSWPWLYLNYRHHGSPFYNTNYLNLATEIYPELVANKTNQDATRVLEERFHSFADVLRYDPQRLVTRYPANLLESLRRSFEDTLVNQWVAWMAWLGVLFAFARRRSKAVTLVLIAGAIYFLLVSLTHWETRYYFFLMVLYAGLAAFAAAEWMAMAREQGWLKLPVFTLIPIALVAAMFALSLAESRKDVTNFLAAQPVEIPAARDYLSSAGAIGGRRIVARKPHLPYLSRNEWIFFPQVKSLDELRVWVENNRVDYIAIGRRELKERKELTALGDPKNAPDWLKPVWAHDDPMLILYKPEVKLE